MQSYCISVIRRTCSCIFFKSKLISNSEILTILKVREIKKYYTLVESKELLNEYDDYGNNDSDDNDGDNNGMDREKERQKERGSKLDRESM